MKLFKLTKNFSKDESGAVTVDWVVLTAALVGIALAIVSTINTGLTTASTQISGKLTSAISANTGTGGGS
jgi:Flp pilus assembly pilin Flp